MSRPQPAETGYLVSWPHMYGLRKDFCPYGVGSRTVVDTGTSRI